MTAKRFYKVKNIDDRVDSRSTNNNKNGSYAARCSCSRITAVILKGTKKKAQRGKRMVIQSKADGRSLKKQCRHNDDDVDDNDAPERKTDDKG